MTGSEPEPMTTPSRNRARLRAGTERRRLARADHRRAADHPPRSRLRPAGPVRLRAAARRHRGHHGIEGLARAGVPAGAAGRRRGDLPGQRTVPPDRAAHRGPGPGARPRRAHRRDAVLRRRRHARRRRWRRSLLAWQLPFLGRQAAGAAGLPGRADRGRGDLRWSACWTTCSTCRR